MSACICGQHLGWAFSNDSGDQFLGIIVTKLSPREVSASELDDIIQLQNEAIHRFSILRLHHENDDQEEDDEEEEDDDEEEVDEVEEEDEVVEEDNEEEERNENGEDDERVQTDSEEEN
jgi:phosphoribosylanthranilate isomerase